VFSRTRHRPLYRSSWIQSTTSNLISLVSILILSSDLHLRLPSGFFPSGFLTKILYSWNHHARYMLRPSHSSWFDHPDIWWRVQIMEFLFMQFSRLSCYPLRHKIWIQTALIKEISIFLIQIFLIKHKYDYSDDRGAKTRFSMFVFFLSWKWYDVWSCSMYSENVGFVHNFGREPKVRDYMGEMGAGKRVILKLNLEK
jgi:hypothetical protein